MGNHFYLWQRVHIVANPATNSFTYMLHTIKSFDYTIIINAEEKRNVTGSNAKFLSKDILMPFESRFGDIFISLHQGL